jgi:hypothetical protein
MTFRVYPRPKGLLTRLGVWSNDMETSLGVLGRVESLLAIPALQGVLAQLSSLPQGGAGNMLQLKATHLPRP